MVRFSGIDRYYFATQGKKAGQWAAVLIDYGIDSMMVHESIAPQEMASSETSGDDDDPARCPAADIWRLGLLIEWLVKNVKAANLSMLEADCLDALQSMTAQSFLASDNANSMQESQLVVVVPDLPKGLLEAILRKPFPLSRLLPYLASCCLRHKPGCRPSAVQLRDILRPVKTYCSEPRPLVTGARKMLSEDRLKVVTETEYSDMEL